MDPRGGSNRRGPPPFMGGHTRPGGFQQRSNYQQHQIPPRMITTNMPNNAPPYYQHVTNHLAGGNNFPPQADVSRMIIPGAFNETQSNMESYPGQGYYTPEMVSSPSPPAFSPYHPLPSPQQQPVFVATNLPLPPFSPNSPNDPNFVGGMPPNPSCTVPTMMPMNVPYKPNQILLCSNCGHCNHLAGIEIEKLKNENTALKQAYEGLRKEMQEREVKTMPLSQQVVSAPINKPVPTLLSPDAKEFVLGENKEVNKQEVPVVSAKGIVDELPLEMPNETGAAEQVAIEHTIPEQTKGSEIFNLKEEPLVGNHEHSPGQSMVKDDAPETSWDRSKHVEAQTAPVGSAQVAVEGIHASLQTDEDDGWNSSEEKKTEPQLPYQSPAVVNNYYQHPNNTREFPRGKYNNEVIGRGRGRSDNNDNRHDYPRHQRGDYPRRHDNRSFKDNRPYLDETRQLQKDFNRGLRMEGPNYRDNNRNFTGGNNQGRPRSFNRDGGNQSSGRSWTNAQPPQSVDGMVRGEDSNASGRDLLTEAKSQDGQINGAAKKNVLKNMVHEIKGDLFSVDKEYSLAHCVAKDFQMGKGIAVKFREEFKQVPHLLDQKVDVGGCAHLKDETNNRYVFYLVTKTCSNGKPTMDTLTQSLQALKCLCEKFGVTKLAMPHIGCGLDKLKWNQVRQVINETFQLLKIHIVVYDFNAEGAPEGRGEEKPYGIAIRHKLMSLPTMEPSTGLIFFGTEDGYMDSTAVSLTNRFKMENDYKKAPKTVGKVWCFKKCPKEQYYIYGLIVAKTFGPVSFVDIESCCKELAKLIREDQWAYMGMEALVEWSEGDETFTEKVVNLLRYTLPRKFVKELWVCFQQSEHDTLKMCTENYIKKSPDHK